jgi:hypothetical protein
VEGEVANNQTGLTSEETKARGAQPRHIRKAINKARYDRQFARRAPAPKSNNYPAMLSPATRVKCIIRGVPEYLQMVVRMRYGAKGTWGHGKYVNATSKGPGRRRVPPEQQNQPAGTKLLKRFIRDSRKEQTEYRAIYAALTGEQYHERYAK